jgi:hypothetical protein
MHTDPRLIQRRADRTYKGFAPETPQEEEAWLKRQKANGHAAVGLAFSALDLQHMRFPPIKFVVPGYVVEGLTLFAGKPKLGKSWLILHAAIAVARGGFTRGDVRCVEGDVLYAALEDNPRRLQSRMTKLLGLQEWPARLEFTTDLPRLKDGGIERVRQWVERAEKPRLIVIDTLQKVRDPKGSQENSYEADYAAVTALKALADEHGVAVVLVHHQRKMEADDPIDTVSGTTGLTGAVDTVLVLYRTGQGTTLYGRGRDIEEVEKAVSFDADLCLWRVEGEARDVHRSDERSRIVTALTEVSQPMSPREIADAAELPYVNVRQLLVRMHKAGEVEKVKRGLYLLSKTIRHNGHNVTSEYGDDEPM